MRQRLNAPMLRLCHPAEWPQSWGGFLWFAAHLIPSDREHLSCHRQIEGDPKFQPGVTLRSWVQISTMQTTSRLKQHQTVCKALHFLDRKRQQMWNVNHNLYIYIIYIYMAVSQNCVWNVLRCSGRTERRGFVTVLVPDLWSVMKYKLYIHMCICIYIYVCVPIVNMYAIYISGICLLKLLTLAAAHFHFSSAHICTTSLLYTCSTQVCLAWLVLVH